MLTSDTVRLAEHSKRTLRCLNLMDFRRELYHTKTYDVPCVYLHTTRYTAWYTSLWRLWDTA